jgi:hypothetical protein
LTEIWVPYGPVEVSFDIKQENLSQVLESQSKKISKEEIEQKAMESAGLDCILVLSGTNGTAQVLDALLLKNKGITKLLHTKQSGWLARRKAQEYQIPSVEQVNTQDLTDIGIVDGTKSKMISQVKNSSNVTVLTSVHYDPLFGLSSAASDIVSLSQETKGEAFKRSFEELPCDPSKSYASWYATRVLQTSPNVNAIEVVETSTAGALALFSGEPEAVHAKVLDFWKTNLTIELPSRAERIIFGCGGGENDKSLTEALGRSFFNVVQKLSLKDSGAKICMLAECSQGLGSEALLRYVTGRFTPGANLDQLSYFDGLEVLLSFYRVQEDLELSMISTLPKYYGEKFQFKMYSGAREAPSSLVSPGSRAKIVVVPDGSSTDFGLGSETAPN